MRKFNSTRPPNRERRRLLIRTQLDHNVVKTALAKISVHNASLQLSCVSLNMFCLTIKPACQCVAHMFDIVITRRPTHCERPAAVPLCAVQSDAQARHNAHHQRPSFIVNETSQAEFQITNAILLVFRTTAAAITGPAKQPLPTSSTPAIKFKALKLHLCARFPLSQLIRFSIVLKVSLNDENH